METVFTNHTYDIEIDNDQQITNLWLTGDWHTGCKGHDADRFKYFLKKAAKDDPERTRYLLMGDYSDFAASGEQKELRHGKIHETTIAKFDEIVEQENRKLAADVKQMIGRTIGCIEGNHSWTFKNGKTATDDLCERLDTKNLGWLSHITLRFHSKNRNKVYMVTVVACHGKAGGKTHGNTINQVADLKLLFPTADIYVMAHDHQRGAWPSTVILPVYHCGKVLLKQKRQFLCRSGSFLKSYTENTSEYVTGRLLRPSDLGAQKLEISFHVDKDNQTKVDIEAIT